MAESLLIHVRKNIYFPQTYCVDVVSHVIISKKKSLSQCEERHLTVGKHFTYLKGQCYRAFGNNQVNSTVSIKRAILRSKNLGDEDIFSWLEGTETKTCMLLNIFL